MKIRPLGICTVLLVTVGCSAKLVVSSNESRSSAGSGGVSDSGACDGCTDPQPEGGDAGAGGTGGAPALGGLGQPCVPGRLTTEASPGSAGAPGGATIKTISHCDEGLSCNDDGNCVAAPNCPHGGEVCIVRHATLSANVDAGDSEANWGISDTPPLGTSANASVERNGVMAMTASEAHVYWVEYGTRDAAGNYQHDGALLAYAQEDGTTSVIASGLDGPIDVEITSSHAYVSVDGAQPPGSPIHPQLLRVSLSGGSAELVQDGTFPSTFIAADSRAFWGTLGKETIPKLYSMTSEIGAVPSVFATDRVIGLAVDGSELYYRTQDAFYLSPVESPAPVALGVLLPGQFVLHDDAIYFVLSSSWQNGLLKRLPRTGGGPDDFRGLGPGDPSTLRRVGDRYFYELQPFERSSSSPGERRVLTGSFMNNDPLIQLLQRPNRLSSVDHLWAATADTFYWSDGRALYKQPLLAP